MAEVPKFEMPYSARLSPHVDRVREHTRHWVRDMGMLGGVPWTEAFYDAADYGGFAPLAFPTASLDELKSFSDWGTWGFFVDDTFLELFLRTRNTTGGRTFADRLRAVLDGAPATPGSPAEKALADLVARTSPDDEDRALIADYLDALLWELHNTAQGRVPDPVDLVEMRRKSLWGELSAKQVRRVARADLPEDLLRDSTMRALVDSFGDVGALRMEVLGFDRAYGSGASTASAVLAVQRFFGCERQQAVDIVCDLISARLRQIGSVFTEFPSLAREYGLDGAARAALSRYAEAMKSWLAGELLWSRRSGRYRSPAVPLRKSFHTPTGLGTGAVPVRRKQDWQDSQ